MKVEEIALLECRQPEAAALRGRLVLAPDRPFDEQRHVLCAERERAGLMTQVETPVRKASASCLLGRPRPSEQLAVDRDGSQTEAGEALDLQSRLARARCRCGEVVPDELKQIALLQRIGLAREDGHI